MSTTDTLSAPRPAAAQRLPLSLRLAVRDLRGGVRGFGVFIACIALGVMVIAGVGALSDALTGGFARQGRTLLGGDVTLTRSHKRAETAERQAMATVGRVSETASMRTMARRTDGSDQVLIELKGVDTAYPLAGAITLKDGARLDALGAGQPGAALTAALDPILLERLQIGIGDVIRLGKAEVKVVAAIEKEPDAITDRLTFGPRVMVSTDTLVATGLVEPGSLVRWRYAMALPDPDADADLVGVRQRLAKALPEAGFVVADKRDPSPRVTRTVERLSQFLTLVGLTSLLVGGVGVANAVATFIDRRRKVVAILKSVGAPSRLVFRMFLAEVMTIAAIGVAIGLALGVLVPVVLTALYGDLLPVRAELSIRIGSLAAAAAYGLLVALVFMLWPLGRAERIRPAALFRDEVAEESQWPHARVVGLILAAIVALAALAILTSDQRRIAIYFLGAVSVVFVVFLLLGWLTTLAARRAPRPRRPELAIALGNLGAPGGLTRSVILSLGTGLSLLSAIALADASLVAELTGRMPTQSPNYFVLDVGKEDYPDLVRRVQAEVPGAALELAPMLRGRLVRLKDQPVEAIKAPPEAEWVLNGDRGLTYADTVPEGSTVVAGTWWEPGYSGPPLVSFEGELGRKLGLAIGDQVTVNVLGRNVTAKVASFREVKWESLAINFVMVFSPNTLKAAPHKLLATVVLPPETSLEAEARVARVIAQAYPGMTAIRVKDAINAFTAIFEKIITAVRAAGSVTLLAGALVLAGALATAQRRRIQQAVILKTLGATRARIISAHLFEYLVAAAVTAGFAVALGALAAWIALTTVMDVPFTFSWVAVGQALGLAIGLVVVFGGLGTWHVLRAPSVPYLRAE